MNADDVLVALDSVSKTGKLILELSHLLVKVLTNRQRRTGNVWKATPIQKADSSGLMRALKVRY